MEALISSINISSYINVALILFLVALGFIIKHVKSLEFIPNSFIPVILLVGAVLYEVLSVPTYTRLSILNAMVDGAISAAIAIGIHSSGKSLIYAFTDKDDFIKSLMKSMDEDDSNDNEEEGTDEIDDAYEK